MGTPCRALKGVARREGAFLAAGEACNQCSRAASEPGCRGGPTFQMPS